MRYLDLFSGISAPTVAWSSLGWKAAAYAEIEPFANAVLSHHYPTVPNLGDVNLFDWEELKNSAEVLIGGSPCQSFSVAGDRQSLDDPRGNLALKFCRIANTTNPVFTIYENVPGILSAKQNPFGELLSILVGAEFPLNPRKGHKWESSGFVVGQRRSVAWRVLCASHFGVPQRRRRVFVVAFDYRAGERLFGCVPDQDIRRLAGIPAAILLEPEGVSRDTSPRRKGRQKTSRNLGSGSESGDWGLNQHSQKPDFWSGKKEVLPKNPTFSRVSHGTKTENPTLGRVNFITETSSSPDIVAFSFVDHGQDCGYLSPTLRSLSCSRPNGGGQVAIACCAIAWNSFAMSDASGTRKDRPHGGIYVKQTEIASTITCSGVDSTIAFRTDNVNSNGIGVYIDDKTHTLSTSSSESIISPNTPPRKLTPTECLRLQGFPDNYLDISYKGKPVAKHRKYRVIGNSMAVPVVRWIGERIDKVTSLIISSSKHGL